MEFIKKNLTKIVMILLVAMFFGTCSSNCTNKNKLRAAKSTIEQNDSIVCVMSDSIVRLNDEIKELKQDLKSANGTVELLNKSNSDLNRALNRNVVVNIKQETRDEQ